MGIREMAKRDGLGRLVKLSDEERYFRFISKIKPGGSGSEADCHIWVGAKIKPKKEAYGQFWDGNKNVLAHRFSYEYEFGKIGHGMTIDHQCNNTLCVNPKHLKQMTLKENIHRGPNQNATKTHCKRGHLFCKENQFKTKRNERICAVCIRLVRGSKKRPPIKHSEHQRKLWRESSKRYAIRQLVKEMG